MVFGGESDADAVELNDNNTNTLIKKLLFLFYDVVVHTSVGSASHKRRMQVGHLRLVVSWDPWCGLFRWKF